MDTRRTLQIRIANRPFRAVHLPDAAARDQALSPAKAWALLEREYLRPKDLSTLTELWHAIAGRRITTTRLSQIREAFLSGAWVLLPPPVEASAPPPPRESITEQLRTAKEVRTWVEMEVTDEEGRPQPGRPYICMLPDGKLESGTLDSRGRVRFDGIDPGTCVFSLTSLDHQSWHRK